MGITYSCITPTAQCREHDTICVLKLVLLWLLLSVLQWFSNCPLFQAPLTAKTDIFVDQTFHMVGRVRLVPPWKFIDAPLGWRIPRLRTTGA